MGRKEEVVRAFYTEHHAGEVPIDSTVQELYAQFQRLNEDVDVSYGLFNGVTKKIRSGFTPGAATSARSRMVPGQDFGDLLDQVDASVEPPKIIEIGNMDFPEFKLYQTGGLIDRILSDHTEEGGLYSGTANILVGESGVGKSTVALQLLAMIKRQHPDSKILYISSEMTRNDLFFFYSKMNLIGNVPTLLLMDHIQGRFDLTLRDTVRSDDYDIILLDSYQDTVVKMTDVLGFKSTQAATWLTNLLIEAADKRGKAIIAIQHLTKGGTYVGSTYLKHATTAMMEMRFDSAGRRYVEFSKNRRGGSGINRRVYYSLDQNGEVVWDEETWNRDREAESLAKGEGERRAGLEDKFDKLFLTVMSDPEKDEAEENQVEESVEENESNE